MLKDREIYKALIKLSDSQDSLDFAMRNPSIGNTFECVLLRHHAFEYIYILTNKFDLNTHLVLDRNLGLATTGSFKDFNIIMIKEVTHEEIISSDK